MHLQPCLGLSERHIQNHRSPCSVIGELNTPTAHFSSCLSGFSASLTVDVTFLWLSFFSSVYLALSSASSVFPTFLPLCTSQTLFRDSKQANSQVAPLSQYNEIGCTQIERCHFLQLSADYRRDLFWYLWRQQRRGGWRWFRIKRGRGVLREE